MRIQNVEPRRGSLAAVTLEWEDWSPADLAEELPGARFDSAGRLLLDRQTASERGIRPGVELPLSALADVVEEGNLARARAKAMYLLSLRDYAKGELVEKLRAESGEEAALKTAERLAELGLLDDERFAARYAEQLLREKGVSARQAVFLLRQKGVAEGTARAAVDACAPDAQSQLAALIERKYASALAGGEERDRRRVCDALARRGFSYDEIRAALRAYGAREDGAD